MVVKNFIHFVINKYLKNYIERLDYEKLNFSLKNGDVLLENLHLKRDALVYLNIPVTVVAGSIEKLRLTIPWKHLTSKPTEIHIDGFYLLIVSKSEFTQDLTEHYADKMVRVQQKLENLRKAAMENKKFEKKDSAFVERMRFQIKQNLVLTVRNLHICYERKSPMKLGHPFSFGITLHYLEVTTVNNAKFRRRIIKGNTILTYKVQQLDSLSIYWNTKCKSRQNLSFDDIVNDLKSRIATSNYKPNDEEMNYILRPVSLATEAMIILKPKEHNYERSTFIFDIQVEQIDFHLDTKQISDMLDFIKFQSYTTIYDRCREYRELLRQYLFDPSSLSDEQKERTEFLESKLDVFHLAYIRHKIETEMYDLPPEIIENNQQLVETEQMPISTTNQVPTNGFHRFRNRLEPLMKMKSKLNNINRTVLDHVKATTTAIFTQSEHEIFFEDLPKFDIELIVNKVNFNILSPITIRPSYCEGEDEIVCCININDAQLSIQRMSITSRVECTIDLSSLRIFGMGHNKQHHSPLLLDIMPSSSPNIHIEFELFPQDQKSDYRLRLNIEPMKIIYDTPTINRLVECFEANEIIIRPAPQIKQRTFLEMQRDCPRKKIFDMKMVLKEVSFLLPEFGVYQQNFSMIRFKFGELMLKSCHYDEETHREDNLFRKNPEERQFYIKYKLEITDLRIFYTQSNKNQFFILRRIPLIDINFYKCRFSDDAHLFKWRIALKTTMREICLSKAILTKVIDHLSSIPVLYSNMSNLVKRINVYLMIFQQHTTLTADLSIYNCYFRFLMNPQRSIRTDFHIRVSKRRNKDDANTHAIITLNEPTMLYHYISSLKQSSQTFYRNDHLKLTYMSSTAKL